jgi:riboflavin kinase/FMN adenylyltransferase
VELLSQAKIDVLWLAGSLMRVRRASFEAIAKTLFDGKRVASVIVGALDARAFAPLLRTTGIPIERIPPIVVDEVSVTSEAIRSFLAEGNLTRVEQLLGRRYAVCGRVVHGFHRGKSLGFPTANVRVRGLALPPNGVYAVRVRCEARVYDAVANLGLKPTFADVERSLEAHVFDFDGDLYGRFAEVAFVAFLRRERKFSSVQALVEQIRTDCAEARRRLS